MISFLFRIFDAMTDVFWAAVNTAANLFSKVVSAVSRMAGRFLGWDLDPFSSWWPLFCVAWVVLILLILLIIAGVALSRWRKDK